MQNSGLIPQGRSMQPQFPEHEHLKCPRCDSTNTKFCYYNNYNLSQPRHFCKNCRRYWTKGGTLRNIPVGGGSRKNTKRAAKSKSKQPTSASASPSPSSSSTLPSLPKPDPDDNLAGIYNPDMDSDQRLLDINGTFSSLLATNGHFAPLSFEPMSSRIPKMPQGLNMMGGPVGESYSKNLWGVQDFSDNAGGIGNPPLELQNNESESFLPLPRDSSCWAGNGWPDLAIYTPGNNLQ